MSAYAHHFVHLSLDSGPPVYVGQVYCTDDIVGGRIASKAARDAAREQRSIEIKIVRVHFGGSGWDIEARVLGAFARSLLVKSDAPTVRPVTVNGWYECTDGTFVRARWTNSGLDSSEHVRTWEDTREYERRVLAETEIADSRVQS